jgi:hypothetical protein
MKISQVIHWLPLAPGSKDKSVLTVYGPPRTAREPTHWAVQGVTAVGTVGIYRLPASHRLLLA